MPSPAVAAFSVHEMTEHPTPDATALVSAAGSAYNAGLRYVYVGNVPHLEELSHTRCTLAPARARNSAMRSTSSRPRADNGRCGSIDSANASPC